MKFQKAADKLYEKLEAGPEGSNTFYKKRRVYPVLNQDGSVHVFNLLTGGTWMKLGFAILFIVVAVGMILEYHNNLAACVEIINEKNALQNILGNITVGEVYEGNLSDLHLVNLDP